MRRIETRGPARGQCNICGEEARLTVDHVPPRSCRVIGNGELRSLVERLAPDSRPPRGARQLQNGVSYRSLCTHCNTEMLGGEYDPALAEFCARVRAIAESRLELPDALTVRVRPQRVIRSLLGHMAAQGVNRYLKGPITEPLRDYLLDSTAALPEAIRVYYWLYPFRGQVLVRDAVRIRMGSDDPILFWLLKFSPLAFMATFDETGDAASRLTRLDPYGCEPIDTEVDVSLALRPLVHEFWPEAPDGDGAVMYGQQAHFAQPVNAKGRLTR